VRLVRLVLTSALGVVRKPGLDSWGGVGHAWSGARGRV